MGMVHVIYALSSTGAVLFFAAGYIARLAKTAPLLDETPKPEEGSTRYLEKQIATLRDEVTRQGTEHERLVREAETVRNQSKTDQAELAQCRLQLEARKHEAPATNPQDVLRVEELQNHLAKADQDLHAANDRATALAQDLENGRNALTIQQAERDALHAQVITLREDKNALEARVTELEALDEDGRSRLADDDGTRKDAAEQIRDLQTRLTSAEHKALELESLREVLAGYVEELDELRAMRNALVHDKPLDNEAKAPSVQEQALGVRIPETSLNTRLERELGAFIGGNGIQSVVVADGQGFVVASAGNDNLNEGLAAVSALAFDLSRRLSNFVSLGDIRYMRATDSNGLELWSRFTGTAEEPVIVSTLASGAKPSDPLDSALIQFSSADSAPR